jgi:hypothetical protein
MEVLIFFLKVYSVIQTNAFAWKVYYAFTRGRSIWIDFKFKNIAIASLYLTALYSWIM